MSLPDGGSDVAWPPEHCATIFDRYREHDAWYSGDPGRLEAVYGRYSSNASTQQGRRSRWFSWSRQADAPTDRQRYHVPMAADVATTSADLLFAEPLEVRCETEAATDRLTAILDEGGVHNTLLEAAETSAALGGVYLRCAWDLDVPYPMLEAVQADQAVPEWRYGRLHAVTFWWIVYADDNEVWRHLERHEAGGIEHALFKGTRTKLGHRQPLNASEATEDLAPLVDEYGIIPTGLTGMTAGYVPNMRPNRKARTSPYGRSDFDSVEPLFDALDETYTSWMRDMRLAKARLIVPRSMVQSAGKGKGAHFDVDQEVFLPIDIEDNAGITPQQFAIRVAEHRDTAYAFVERIIATAGYSGRTFGLPDRGGDVTATEVNSADRRSLITRAKKSRYWQPVLADLYATLLEIDKTHLRGPAAPERPTVAFPEAVASTPRSVAETIELLDRASAISTEMKVRMFNPEWDASEVEAEVARIQAETGAAMPDPMALGALP